MSDQLKQFVPPFSKADIIEIIKGAIKDGTICSNQQTLEDDETYVLKVVNGDIVLVKEEE